jgi:hypothetical protein
LWEDQNTILGRLAGVAPPSLCTRSSCLVSSCTCPSPRPAHSLLSTLLLSFNSPLTCTCPPLTRLRPLHSPCSRPLQPSSPHPHLHSPPLALLCTRLLALLPSSPLVLLPLLSTCLARLQLATWLPAHTPLRSPSLHSPRSPPLHSPPLVHLPSSTFDLCYAHQI